jgi:hypothetical protein
VNDAELEAALRRYRPAGPPVELRAAIVGAGRSGGPGDVRRRDLAGWSMVAASILLTTMFYWLAGIERQRQSAIVTPLSPFEQAIVLSSPGEPQP